MTGAMHESSAGEWTFHTYRNLVGRQACVDVPRNIQIRPSSDFWSFQEGNEQPWTEYSWWCSLHVADTKPKSVSALTLSLEWSVGVGTCAFLHVEHWTLNLWMSLRWLCSKHYFSQNHCVCRTTQMQTDLSNWSHFTATYDDPTGEDWMFWTMKWKPHVACQHKHPAINCNETLHTTDQLGFAYLCINKAGSSQDWEEANNAVDFLPKKKRETG